ALARIERAIMRLEYLGENDMGWLSYEQAMRFHGSTSSLARLSNELNWLVRPAPPAPSAPDLRPLAETLALAADHLLDCDDAGDSMAQSDEWGVLPCRKRSEANMAEHSVKLTGEQINLLIACLDRAAPDLHNALPTAAAIRQLLLDALIERHKKEGR